MGKNTCKSTKMSKVRDKMETPMPVEKVMGPNRNNMENYGDQKPITQNNMKSTL